MIYQGQTRDGLSSSGALKAVGAGWLLLAMADVSLIVIVQVPVSDLFLVTAHLGALSDF
jgi:hypothetical protein